MVRTLYVHHVSAQLFFYNEAVFVSLAQKGNKPRQKKKINENRILQPVHPY